MMLTIATNPLEEDPFVYVERTDIKESFLFDCGLRVRGNYRKVRRLWGLFITHAHIDHLVGFDHLIRSLLNESLTLRIFGPPGILTKIAGKLTAYDWDRAYDQTLILRVTELGRTERLTVDFVLCNRFQATEKVIENQSNCIRSTATDELKFAFANHGGSPCVCYSYSLRDRIKVDKERLLEQGLQDGPWIGELLAWKRKGIQEDQLLSVWGVERSAVQLSSDLLFIEKGKKLVYLTDTRLDESVRRDILDLAWEADLLFCEATFKSEDKDLALQFNHLTAIEAAEFAQEAHVARLILNHPSRRYHGNYRLLLKEARSVFANTDIISYKGAEFEL